VLWNIARLDQMMNYGGRVVGTALRHTEDRHLVGSAKLRPQD
jgi:hypothetical protein